MPRKGLREFERVAAEAYGAGGAGDGFMAPWPAMGSRWMV